MSNHGPIAAEAPVVAGVAGASFPPHGGADTGGGGDVGTGVEGVLPFTGSVFTAPMAALGLILTFAGWVLLRLGLRED